MSGMLTETAFFIAAWCLWTSAAWNSEPPFETGEERKSRLLCHSIIITVGSAALTALAHIFLRWIGNGHPGL